MKGIVGKVVRGFVLALVCLAMFDVPASYLASRGWSPWLSLAFGLLTFPILSLVWHALSEHARKKAPPLKPATRGWERFLLRSTLVGVLVIGALVALAGGKRVLSGFRNHALWFIPDATSPLVADSKLFDFVPPNAEVLIWLRVTDDTRAQLGAAVPSIERVGKALQAEDVVAAIGKDGFWIGEHGDAEVVGAFAELFAELQKLGKDHGLDAFTDSLAGSVTKAPGNVRYWVSPGWTKAVSTGRPSALVDLFSQAPDDAFLVAVTRPAPGGIAKRDLPDVTSGVVYVRLHRGRVVVAIRGDFASDTEAKKRADEVRDSTARIEDHECWSVADGRAGVSQTDRTVTMELSIPLDRIESAMRCLDKK
ncbi:MAG TPA: hypothetical protein VMZ53_26705 [Kofleriaceae bacterium]|nr:hypothetical protein [Kofleriaceae bacterium]